jgi:hypothetical protein
LLGIFRRGWNEVLAAVVHHEPLPLASGKPEPWPTTPSPRADKADEKAPAPGNLQL